MSGLQMLIRESEIQQNLAYTLGMFDCLLDLERLVYCRDREAQSS
jgi:hypothetical protein